jgi:hypothetical protein
VIPLHESTELQRRQLVLADNRIALNAGWDLDMLQLELRDLAALGADLSVLGFTGTRRLECCLRSRRPARRCAFAHSAVKGSGDRLPRIPSEGASRTSREHDRSVLCSSSSQVPVRIRYPPP